MKIQITDNQYNRLVDDIRGNNEIYSKVVKYV